MARLRESARPLEQRVGGGQARDAQRIEACEGACCPAWRAAALQPGQRAVHLEAKEIRRDEEVGLLGEAL
jgi:hypothetical protein